MTNTPFDVRALKPRHRDPIDVLRIAHKGAEAEGIEDIDRCVAEAATAGAHMVEIDVRITKDEELVATHDSFVVDDDGRRHWLHDLTYEELTRVAGRRDLAPFDRTVRAIRDQGLGLYCEIKSLTPTAGRRLVAELRELELLDSSILATSKGELTGLIRELAPNVPRSIMFGSIADDPVHLARLASADFVHPCWEKEPMCETHLSQDWIDRVRTAGLGIVAWHEERPDVIDTLLQFGLDGICSDDVALLTSRARVAGPLR